MKKIVFLFIMVFALFLTGCFKKNPVSGKYRCYNREGVLEYGSHVFDLKLNNDKTFEFTQENVVAKGKYTYELEDKDTQDSKFYEMTMNFNNIIVDGEEEDPSTAKWELGLSSKKNDYEAVIYGGTGMLVVCKKD